MKRRNRHLTVWTLTRIDGATSQFTEDSRLPDVAQWDAALAASGLAKFDEMRRIDNCVFRVTDIDGQTLIATCPMPE